MKPHLRVAWLVAIFLLTGAASSCSSKSVVVPSVVGKPVKTAEQALTASGLTYAVVYQPRGPAQPPPIGTVISQAPSSGSQVTHGVKVTIVVYGSG